MNRENLILPKRLFLIGIVLFTTFAGLAGNMAARHTKGLVRNGMFQFSVDGVTLLYWGVFGVSVLLALAALCALVLQVVSPNEPRREATQSDSNRRFILRRPY